MNLRRFGLLAVFACLLQACVTVPVPRPPVNETWAQYQLVAGRVNSWNMRGRAAIFVDDEVHNVGLRWRRNFDEFVLVLEAPFGQGVIRLESSRETAYPIKLSISDGQVVYAEDAESALLDVVGFGIPVSGLQTWIKGLPQKTASFSQELGEDGRLKSLSQNEWRINYLDYFEPSDPSGGLPRKIFLEHDRLSLKLVIEHWHKPLAEVIDNELFPSFN